MFSISENIEKIQDLFLYKREISRWIKETYIPYCKENKVKDFHDFIYRGWNGFCGESFGVLSTAPEILLSNIIIFKEMYNQMDPDFKQDLMHSSFTFYLKKISLNKPLKKYINEIIQNKLNAVPILE